MSSPQDPNQPPQSPQQWSAPPPPNQPGWSAPPPAWGAPSGFPQPGWPPPPAKRNNHSCLIGCLVVFVLFVLGVGACTVAVYTTVSIPTPAMQASGAPAFTPATAGATTAANAGDANIVVQKTLVFPAASSVGGGNVQIIAVVKNTGGKPAKLGGVHSESFTLYAKDGSVLKTGDLTPFPQYVAPGATGYLGGWANFTDSASFATVGKADASVTSESADSVPAQTLTTAKVAVAPDDFKVWLEAKGTVTNTGTKTVDWGYIGIILLDSAGNPIGFLEDNITAMGILAGQTKGFTTDYPFAPASLAPKVASTLVFAFAYELF